MSRSVPILACSLLISFLPLAPAMAEPAPLVGDVVPLWAVPGMGPEKLPYGAAENDVSLYMLGSVHVAVVFVEGVAGGEDWDTPAEIGGEWITDRRAYCLAEIEEAMAWWAARNPDAGLSFTVESCTVASALDPIEQAFNGAWLGEATAALGYGAGWSGLYAFANDARAVAGADWAFVIYVVDSLNDADGMFTDGTFALTLSNMDGQELLAIMTYDNQYRGVENMDGVAAHETGHIFGALDEYAPCSCSATGGYLLVDNQNCMDGCLLDEDSIMRHDWIAYPLGAVDVHARGQVGWVDDDGDGVPDILDTQPTVALGPLVPGEPLHFTGGGTATVTARPAVNPAYNSATINTIAAVEWRLDAGAWQAATPADGAFDEAEEDFTLAIVAPDPALYQVEVRAVNSAGNAGPGAMAPLDALSGADAPPSRMPRLTAAPNPFNPTTILRCELPAGGEAVLAIHDLLGRRVRILHDGQAAGGPHAFRWDGRDGRGRELPSGCYLARLTTPRGTISHKLILAR